MNAVSEGFRPPFDIFKDANTVNRPIRTIS